MMTVEAQPTTRPARWPSANAPRWSYDQAFGRHRGLVDAAEQQRLRGCRVAIAGLGGVGGAHLLTLARLGIGAFTIADPDAFELANFNRQAGANVHTLDQGKAAVMATEAQAINPELDVRVFSEAITPANVAAFLDGADILVDGIDFFAPEARRLIFQEARRRGLWAVTAGPIGFSTAWLTFDPAGMSFDDYFDLHDGMDRLDVLVAFAVGLAPQMTHRAYIDMTQVDLPAGRGPSAGLACQLCTGVAAAEVLKIVLGRGPLYPAPYFHQFDAYRCVLRHGCLRWGNRHPWQRLKRWWLRRAQRQAA